MGQYETSDPSFISNNLYQNSIIYSKKFLDKFSESYNKCALLIPDKLLNQFNELKDFPNNHPIYGLKNVLTEILNSEEMKESIFSSISHITTGFDDGDLEVIK